MDKFTNRLPETNAFRCHVSERLHKMILTKKFSQSLIQSAYYVILSVIFFTRQLSYRKDDHVMRPIYGCPENFCKSHGYFSWNFNGPLFRSILWMWVQNLKFIALLIPEIIEVTLKLWAVPGYRYAPFSPKFLMGFCSDGPCECTGQIWSP